MLHLSDQHTHSLTIGSESDKLCFFANKKFSTLTPFVCNHTHQSTHPQVMAATRVVPSTSFDHPRSASVVVCCALCLQRTHRIDFLMVAGVKTTTRLFVSLSTSQLTTRNIDTHALPRYTTTHLSTFVCSHSIPLASVLCVGSRVRQDLRTQKGALPLQAMTRWQYFV